MTESPKYPPLPLWFQALSLLSACILLPWPLLISFTGFLFDDPGSGKKSITWIMAFSSWFYPLFVIIIIGLGRRKFRTSAPLGSLIVSLPFIALIILMYVFHKNTEDPRWGLFTYNNEVEQMLVDAVAVGDLESIEQLWLEEGVNLDAVSSRGNTPLMAAYKEDQMESFQLLLNLGADINFKPNDNVGSSIAGYIIRDQFSSNDNKKARYFDVLINNGLDPTLSDTNRSLMYLSASANTQIMQRLIKVGADYNQLTLWGTPLIAALHSRNWDSALILLSYSNIIISPDTIDAFNSTVDDNKLLNIPEGRKKVYESLLYEKGIDESLLKTYRIEHQLSW